MMEPIDRLFNGNSKFVYNIAMRMTANKQDAEDITQNVFVKLIQKLGSFREEADIKTFIYRMTVNESIDLLRKRKHTMGKQQITENLTDHHSGDVNAPLVLDRLLQRLSPDHRALVLLSEISGFSYKEIAAILNINIGTVKSRLSRAMQKLTEFAQMG